MADESAISGATRGHLGVLLRRACQTDHYVRENPLLTASHCFSRTVTSVVHNDNDRLAKNSALVAISAVEKACEFRSTSAEGTEFAEPARCSATSSKSKAELMRP